MSLARLHGERCTSDLFAGTKKKSTVLPTKYSAFLVENSGIEPLTSCMPCKRSPNSLAFVHTLCTVRKENQRIFVHIKRPAIPTAFLGRKYDLQAADFQDDAVWGVIWLADK